MKPNRPILLNQPEHPFSRFCAVIAWGWILFLAGSCIGLAMWFAK